MQLVFVFTIFLSLAFALGIEIFTEETISAFRFDFENEISSIKTIASFNVMDYGAVGNGEIDDSPAFNKAWNDVCNVTVSEIATLEVPQGKTFLLNPLVFQGPCQAKSIHFQLGGTLIAPRSTTWATETINTWIEFSGVYNLVLDGDGKIDGQGALWWQSCKKISFFGMLFDCKGRPGTLHFHKCNGLRLKGLTHMNSPRAHIKINNCTDVILSNLHIIAPEDSPNTDGIDISDSNNIQIQDSNIGTGDDCIAINGGTSFVNITGVNCGPGHGISIGSLGDGGAYDTVEEVHVTNCTLRGTQNGVRIKTFQGSPGFARKISFEHIAFYNVKNPIIINQFYQDKGKLRSFGTLETGPAIKVSDVTYSDLHGTSISEPSIDLNCDNVIGCSNIVLRDISIRSTNYQGPNFAHCNNAHGFATSTVPNVPCLA